MPADRFTAVAVFSGTCPALRAGDGWKTAGLYLAALLGFIYLMFEWIVPAVWYRWPLETSGLF